MPSPASAKSTPSPAVIAARLNGPGPGSPRTSPGGGQHQPRGRRLAARTRGPAQGGEQERQRRHRSARRGQGGLPGGVRVGRLDVVRVGPRGEGVEHVVGRRRAHEPGR